MPVDVRFDAPIEIYLEDVARSRSGEFPNRARNYFDLYKEIKRHVAENYYANNAAGLSGESGGRFTKHDIGHVDDVLRKAWELLGYGVGVEDVAFKKLSPYEVFALSTAILLHDAGNAYGRDGHERAAHSILSGLGSISPLTALEKRIIGEMARAHGGKTLSGSKDTITDVIRDPVARIDGREIHTRSLAAVLRLADELSDNSTRADMRALDRPYLAPESVIHNLFCTVVNVNVAYDRHVIDFSFDVSGEMLNEIYIVKDSDGERNTLLVDYIADRLEKSDRERRYCSRFLREYRVFDTIRAKLNILEDHEIIHEVAVELSDTGYPATSERVREKEPKFDGASLREWFAANRAKNMMDEENRELKSLSGF